MRNPSGRGAGHAVPGFLSPFRLSAFASWVILRPLGKFSLPRGRPTGGRPAGPQRGCRVAHEQDPTGQGALLIPGTMVRSRPATILRPAPAASLRPVPIPRWNIPSAGVTFTRRHQGFTHVRPSPQDGWLPPRSREASPLPAGLLLARDHRMEREPLRLVPRASHPAVTHDAHRGGDRPSRTDPSTTPSTSVEPQRCLPLSLMHPHFAPSRTWLPAPPRGRIRPVRAAVPARPD